MKLKKLVVISHTEHYLSEGKIVGWGATVNEINYLADYWDEVIHIACFYDKEAAKSSLEYTKENIKFVPIPPYGGKKLLDKVLIITKIPIIVKTVLNNLNNASDVQLRLPTSMGLYLLPLFSFFIPRKFTFWVKYAGDWNQKNPPFSNKLQRKWLKKDWAKCKVTINGYWEDQPIHCKSFENPCLTADDLIRGKQIFKNKNFKKPFTFCFVGRMDGIKGISRIINSFKEIPEEYINEIHMIGDGVEIQKYKSESKYLKDKIFFHGAQNKSFVHEYIAKSDFFLLPSLAEGFPKVVAEAACYGTIPIVSDVGSIAHYINESNGFLWKIKDEKVSYEALFVKALSSDSEVLISKSNEILKLAELFTFDNYMKKLKIHILKTN